MVYLVPFLLYINHHLINLSYFYTFTGMYSIVLMCYLFFKTKNVEYVLLMKSPQFLYSILVYT